MPEPRQAHLRRIRATSFLVLCAVGTSLLAKHFAPDGHTHGSLPQFFGRFHPLIVHLPIGLVLLVPVLELAGIWGKRLELRAAAGWVLGLGAAVSVAAALDGWLLAWSGGYSGPLVDDHLSAGVDFAMVCAAAASLRAMAGAGPAPQGRVGRCYAVALAGAVLMLVWASHLGGEITHGGTYLSEYMPGRLKTLLGLKEKAKPAPPPARAKGELTLYAAKIDPILQRSCVSCHNPTKVKGGLRMDTYAELMKGGKGGEEIDPWHPETSELVRRITLPPDDDDHMPNNGKNPLSTDEINLIETWIAAGASGTQPAVPVKVPVQLPLQ